MPRALIIGDTGGIGKALSSELRGRGVGVTGVSRSRDGLDLADPVSVEQCLSGLDGPYDLVVVASGILASGGSKPEKSLEAIDGPSMARVMAVNAIGPALVLRHVPALIPRKERCVVAVLTARVGSIGDNGLGGWYSYRASKAAANQIVHTAAIEIARKRKEAIVVALHPGTVNTPFTRDYSAHRKQEPEASARHLLGVIDGLTPADTGCFFDWAGKPIPW